MLQKTLERLALEHHLAQIQSVSSFSAAELKAILWEFRDSITSQFTQHIIINYVNELVERLKGIRLIQEVQTEMGEVTHRTCP
ncbi:MAG: hypothetical protein R2932_50520 [Caldilineaceae bacterium]